MELGKNIRHLRQARDMTQEALADALSLSVQAISRYETGAAYPDIEMLPVIAGYFGVTVDELLGVNAEMKEKRKKDYFDQARALEQDKIDERIELFRKAHAEYPGDWDVIVGLIENLELRTENEENLEQMRLLAEKAAKNCPDMDWRTYILHMYMRSEPDAVKAERFAFKWGVSKYLTVQSMLWERFNPYRGGEDAERTRGLHQWEMLRNLEDALSHFTALITCGGIVDNGLKLLDFIAELSHNPEIEKPDMWAAIKIDRITRIANSMFVLQRNDEAFDLLDKAAALVENMLALPDGTELDYGNESYWRLAAVTKLKIGERNVRYLELNYKIPLYEPIEIDLNDGHEKYIRTNFYPNFLLYNLESAYESDGWPGFYMAKDEPRYKALIERLKAAIVVSEE